jgi:3D-(3,5/4)-trihydroxycyclohexane-1,2-dione acylhydrolase (decyclizing)
LDELETALKAALKETRPTLIDIKTLPKTMTHGYGGWWNTGLTMLPRNDKQRAALSEKQEKLKNARKY